MFNHRGISLKVVFIILSVICFTYLSNSEENQKFGTLENPYIVPVASSSIKVDGTLNEPAWQKAQVIELNYEVSPRDNVKPPVRTEALLTYNQSHFYIGFRCYDPEPTQIRAHFRDRDSTGSDDWVAVEIDTYNDSRRAFTLFSTPYGVQIDGISDAAGIKDYNWDMIYDSAGKIFSWGYGVEIAIPFSSLRFQRTKESQIWGINIVRGYPRDIRYQIWAQPYDRGNNCRVCQYLRIKGFANVSPGRNIEINPTLTGITTEEKDPFPEGEYSNRDKNIEAGLTARWGITPNLALSGTLNPDFSQVEADAAQLDINQPFALFYDEKRPFFTEGLDFFRTPLNIIYTRTMRDPQWGLKLTGKEQAYAMGAYVVNDDITNLIFPGSQSSRSLSMDQQNTSTVVRLGRDIWNNSTIGLIFTNRSGTNYFNRVYGVDTNLRISRKDEVVLQLLGSSTKYDAGVAEDFEQPQDEFRDKAISATYTHKTNHHRLDFLYTDIGNKFRADIGFLPQVGFRKFGASSNYEWRAKKPNSWWSKFFLYNEIEYTTETDGTLLNKYITNAFTYQGIYQSYLTARNTLSRQRYNNVEFTLVNFNFSAGFRTMDGNLALDIAAILGDGIDFVNTRDGNRFLLAPNLTYDIGAHLRINLNHTFEKMNVQNQKLYTANISQASIIYFFNARTFIRSLFQYYNYNYNVSNYLNPIEPQFKQFFTQLLFSYKINPRTVFFLGYSDNYFGNQGYRLTKKDYTLFVKIGYAWVL
jgi:hypothetical protein